ncbi:MAG: HAMP domain-containing histidine kinase [Gammaproteobacteria bacterium]|nr:HAMP domain-containing histidine kinase [Gammaproteobacteria bacterium]
MSIRRILLFAFLCFSVVTAALVTSFTYTRASAALKAEIRRSVETQARDVVAELEALVFERVEDVYGWSRVEPMQELKVDDVDKRLANYLRDVKTSYAGIYENLSCVRDGKVLAASEPGLIGTRWNDAPVWLDIEFGTARISLTRPAVVDGVPVLTLSTRLDDAFSGRPLGTLHALYDWTEIDALLDYAMGASGRDALVVDAAGRVIAASANFRRRPGIADVTLSRWHDGRRASGVNELDGAPLAAGRQLVGFARALGYKGLPDLGWTVLVLTPQRIALAPSRALLHALIALFLVTAGVAALLAIGISGRIARPIQSLTALTRAVDLDAELPRMPSGGGSEVEELGRAFARMLEDLQRTRRERERVAKLAAAGEMAAMLAHEVRNPLGILRSSTQLLARESGLSVRGREMLGYMLGECDRINGLVQGLLDSARPRAPVFAPLDLAALVRGLGGPLAVRATEKGVNLRFEAPSEPVVLEGDRDQILQAVLNLAINALQAAPEGGTVAIRCRAAGTGAALEVADDGPGIPPAERQRILEPFVSHRAGGIGLGLAVVQDIVQRHGGTLAIGESDLGGARFTLTLPLTRKENPT